MDTSTPGLSVHHQLLELAQSHVHWVGDAMHPPHPLLSPSPPAFSIFQHRIFSRSQFFAPVSQIIGASASVLPMNIQDWFPLGLTGLISLQSNGLSRVFSSTTVQKEQCFGAQLSFRTKLTLNFMPYLIHCGLPGVFFKCEPSRKLLIILLLFLGLAAM